MTPSGGEPAEPELVWQPELTAPGAWGIGVTNEFVRRPFVRTLVDGEGDTSGELLGRMWGTTFTGAVGFGSRFGVGVAMPVWWTSEGVSGGANGVTPGDLRLWLPVNLVWSERGKPTLAAVLEGTAPTGDASEFMGQGSFGGGLRLAAGQRGETLGWNGDLGVNWAPGNTYDGIDHTWTGRLGLAADVRPIRWFGFGVEGWASYPLSGRAVGDLSGELLGRVGVRVMDRVAVDLAGGTAAAPGVGSSDGRVYLRLGVGSSRAPRVKVVEKPVETPVVAAAPTVELRVHVKTADGAPHVAALRIVGPDSPRDLTTDASGNALVRVRAGNWSAEVAAEGFGQQTLAFVVEEERYRAVDLDVVLQTAAHGDAALAVTVRDVEGRPIDHAVVALDGVSLGRTGNGGTLALLALEGGSRSLTVEAPDYLPADPRPLTLHEGENAVSVTLQRPPGQVHVVTRSAAGTVDDAVARFVGPEDILPEPIGPTGERTWTLVPGHWLVAVSAASFGLQEREVTVEPGSTALVVVDVVLRKAEPGSSRLVVRAIDPAGVPVTGATVRIDGDVVGATANEGSLAVEGLHAGTRRVEVSALHARPAEAVPVELGPGTREIEIPLRWMPGVVHVRARGVEAALVDAVVRVDGPTSMPPTQLGPDGEATLTLDPGEWTIALSSPAYGLQERDVVVLPGDDTVLDLDATLLSAMGSSELDLTVARLDGERVAGARLSVDGRDAGATASGGSLTLRGIAPGTHHLVVRADLLGTWERDVKFGSGPTPVRAELEWGSADVRVRARAQTAPAEDALARFYGADSRPPTPLGATGERVFALEPGPWTLVVSSPKYGFAERDLDVETSAQPVAVDVNLVGDSTASVLVQVVDPAGTPVHGATLVVGREDRALGETGVSVLTDVRPGALALSVRAPGFAPLTGEKLAVVSGAQTRRLRMQWLARPLRVSVRGADGVPVAAEVRLAGPGKPGVARADADGVASASVLPGVWQVLVSAPEYGAWRQDVLVDPGVEPVAVVATLSASRIAVTASAVEIHEQVQFDFDQASIQASSHGVLEEVVSALLLHPEITRIEVQGHTDTKGTDVYNMDLSQRRADAVRQYLMNRGVAGERLVAIGYGATRPIATNETEGGRGKNRRVQFEIVRGR